MVRLLGAAAAFLLMATISGCSAEEPDPGPDSAADGAKPSRGATLGQTAPPGHEELAPDVDESPDGPPPKRDDALSADELTALLRTTASVRASGAHCGPDQVEVTLVGFDMAAGHRFTSLSVRNVSGEMCVVEGVPGVGVRGAWGRRFLPEVERGTSSAAAVPVELLPGASATSLLEWTGELGGAESERASLVVVQLARGQVPVGVPARLVGDPADAEPLDIGALTTLRLTPFVLAD